MATKHTDVKQELTLSTVAKKFHPLINRNFTLLWSGQVASTIGDYIFDTTLVLWIATSLARSQAWGPLAVGGVLIAAAVPVLVMGPFAGVFADRWEKRRTMLWMDALRALLIVFLLLFTGIARLPFLAIQLPVLWQLVAIYATVLLTSTCGQFFEPSHLGLLGALVDEEEQAKASSLLQMVTSFAIIVGPSIGTLLFFSLGVQLALVLNICSFAVSFLTLMAIKPVQSAQIGEDEAEETQSFLREFTEGISFFASNRILTTLLIAGMIVVFGEGSLNVLDIFFLQQNLHTSAEFYGLLGMALGAGLTIGALVAGLLAKRLGAARTFSLSLLLGGVSILVYARMTGFFPALVMLFLYGVFVAGQNVAAMPLVLHTTPEAFIGRIGAVFNPLMTLASLLSIALAGILDTTLLHRMHVMLLGISLGPVDSIFMATGIIALIAGFYAMVSLRGVNLPSDEASAEVEEMDVEGA